MAANVQYGGQSYSKFQIFEKDNPNGDTTMTFGTNDLYMTLIQNQPLAKRFQPISNMAAQKYKLEECGLLLVIMAAV